MAGARRKSKGGRWARVRDAARWGARHLRTGVTAIGVRGGLLIAAAVVVLWGLGAARAWVGRMPRYRVYPSRFRAKAPPWCAEDLAAVEFPRHSYSIFDPALTRQVAAAYQQCPWVAEVVRVEKRFPNELRVELALREPAAFVRLPGACHAIDVHAVHLPLPYHRWDHANRPLPLVFGVESDPPPPGQRWADRKVTAAASVLATLAAEPSVLRQIHVVDVANLEGDIDPLRSEILLFARQRVRINWGRPPDTRKFGEPPARHKLARLRRHLARPVGAGDSIDLRFPDDAELAGP
ncbi:MAG: cell division protein FtsQ/DivIB [bacterium]